MMQSICARWLWVPLLLTAVGCSVQRQAEPEAQASESPQITHISLAVSSAADTKEIGDLIASFNSAHSDYQVDLINLPSDRYDETLNMLMTSGQGPDVFQLGTGWLTAYDYKNWLLDLSEVADDRIKDAYPEWAADYKKENAHYYAIPSALVTTRLIYNKELLESAGCAPEPPTTLAELQSCANRISQAGTGNWKYGFALPAGDDQAGFQYPLETASTYSGVYYYNYAKGSYDFSVYEPWFSSILEMKHDGGLFPGELTLTTDTALTQFAQGNVGMMIVTNRDFKLLSRMQPLSFTLGIAEPPALETGDKGKGALMIDAEPPFVISAFTGHKREAAELWAYLLSPEYLGALYKAGDIIPTRADVRGDPQYQPAHSDFAAFLPNAEDSIYPQAPAFILKNIPTPYSPKNISVDGRMKAYRDILQEIRPADEALHDLTEQFNSSLQAAIYNKIDMNYNVFPDFDPRHPLAEKPVEK